MIRRQFGVSSGVAGNVAIFARVCAYLTCSILLAACGGGGGGGGGTATPSSTGSTQPSLTFTASSAAVAPGDSVTLSWQSTNTDSCQASGDWTGTRPTSGTESSGALQSSQTFVLSCSGAGGGTLHEVSVNVQNGISLSFNSDQSVVLINGQVHLSWTANNADSCEASGDWTGDRSLSGTYTTPALTQAASYKLTCFAQGESAESLLTVGVTDPTVRWQAPTENVDGTPLTTLASFNVYWGDSSRNYSGSANVGASELEWEIPFGSGTYYIAVTAVDADTSESAYSNEIQKIIP